jgi:hypothetical protein
MVAYVLILLAGVSAIVLFFKASEAASDEIPGAGTLWGIFIIGLILAIDTADSLSLLFPATAFLLVLALFAVGTLLYKAAIAQKKEIHGKRTLWGLFLVALVGGVCLITKFGLRK